MLGRAKNVAMQYSPKNAIPYVGDGDAGTVELVRGTGVKVVSSADLVQKYERAGAMSSLSLTRSRRSIDRIAREAFSMPAKKFARRRRLRNTT